MTIEEILSEWKKDAIVDRLELGDAAAEVSSLHAKYLSMLFQERSRLLKINKDLAATKKLRWEYWNGVLSIEDIRANGWDPQPLKLLKQDIPLYLEADEVLSDIQLRSNVQQEKINVLDSILKHLAQRGYNITSAINWEKLKGGL